VIGLLGAGNYASSVLVPAFAKTRARLRAIASANGLTGTHVGKKFGFERSTTDNRRGSQRSSDRYRSHRHAP